MTCLKHPVPESVVVLLQIEKLLESKSPSDVLQNMCQSSDCNHNLP